MIQGAEARLAASVGRPGLERLQASTVAVVGAGLLGGAVIHHLALLGVGMVIIDRGRVEPENLGNQGFSIRLLGDWKSGARALQVAAMNPDCEVHAVNGPIEGLGLGALAGADLLIAGLDGRAARARVNHISQRLGIPFIDAAVDGSGARLLGTVTVYDPRGPDGACYLCRYRAGDLAAIAREGRGPGCPSWRKQDQPETPPTLVASPFGGVVGGLQALWATRVLLGRPGEFANTRLLIDCDQEPRVRTVALRRKRDCLADHGSFDRLQRVSQGAVGELLRRACADLGSPCDALILHDRPLVVGGDCLRCGARTHLVRVAETLGDGELRCGCGAAATLVLTDRLSREQAERIAARRWTDLGLPPADVVTAVAGRRRAHYVVGDFTPTTPSRAGVPDR